MEADLIEIPANCKPIFNAEIEIEIKRFRYKKWYKEKFLTTEIYKEGDEKNKESFFYKRIVRMIKLKDKEEFKFVFIQKIKYLGYTIPQS